MSDVVEEKNDNTDETNRKPQEFDFTKYPDNTLFYERRLGRDRRLKEGAAAEPKKPAESIAPGERRAKKERRRRIDPTTFEKQYSDDELEFMNAMQRFKEMSGKSFPTHGEVLRVAATLGYRRVVVQPDHCWDDIESGERSLLHPSSVEA